jgi:predicted nucleic acid-binding protein
MTGSEHKVIAIDSSLLTALLVPNDVWHTQAVAVWQALKTHDYTPVYFDCVAAESISTIARRLHEKGWAAQFPALIDQLNDQVPLDRINWLLPDVPRLYPAVLDLMRSSSGELNFNDALIALACRERSLPAIASFDGDFDHVPWLRRVSRPADVGG